MSTVSVGIREFRENLSSYLETDSPVEITRHGDTVGLFIPTKPEHAVMERARLTDAQEKWFRYLQDRGITEEWAAAEFTRLKKSKKKQK